MRPAMRSLMVRGFGGGLGQLAVLREIAGQKHVLQPHGPIGLERLGNPHRRSQVPTAVEFHEDLNVVSEGVAQLAHRRQRLLDIGRRDVFVLVALGRAIEGPDLDGLDAVAVDQLMHDLFRLFVEVVAVAETSVVEANFRIGLSPQQAVNRNIQGFPKQVPQRQIDGAQHPHLRPARHLEIKVR